MKQVILVLLLVMNAISALTQQGILKTWYFDKYKVELVAGLEIQESYGPITPFDNVPSSRKIFRYAISKEGQEGFWNHRVTSDSCTIDFLDFPKNRPLNGQVATHVFLHLCDSTLELKKIVKPVLDRESMLHGTIRPLMASIYTTNTYIDVVHFNDGKPKTLHEKSIEGIDVFLKSAYLVNPYRSEEFKDKCAPHFEVSISTAKETHTLLFYWDLFIIEGYCYDVNSGYTELFDIRFWEANNKLLGL